MKKSFLIFLFFCALSQSIFASPEKDLYLQHIEYCLHAYEKLERVTLEDRPNLINLCGQIYDIEKAHPSYVQCLNAQPSFFYGYQVIAQVLYEKLIGELRRDFVILRHPSENIVSNKEDLFIKFPSLLLYRDLIEKLRMLNPNILAEHEKGNLEDEEEYRLEAAGENVDDEDEKDDDEEDDAAKYIDKTDLMWFKFNDTIPDICKELISISFTMETYQTLDSAMYVFLQGTSPSDNGSSKKLNQHLDNLFGYFNIPREIYEPYIEELVATIPRTKAGLVNQILIPKEKTREYLYLSEAGGFLGTEDSDFEHHFENFQKNRLEEGFRTFRNFQGRVIAGGLFEEPGVKIIRHTLIPVEDQRAYELFVREKIEQMLNGGCN